MAWYKDWFDRDEYELVYHERDEQEAEQIIDLLERIVHPSPGDTVLDVGCGRGRHARILARRGYRITGIDLSEQALAQARHLAAQEGLAIRFLRGDMREPVGTACFDGVVNLFTAFGYFDEEIDHRHAIEAMATALQPGGWFFQDFLNAPYVQNTLVPEDIRIKDDHQIRQRRWIRNGRINKEITLHPLNDANGTPGPFCESVRLLTLEDFRTLYDDAGLTLIDTFGDYQGRPYTPSSPRLIMYACKQ
ncbi:MAG: SAM-dependent methyltransferase [Rhodothermales bacterium]